MAKKKKGVFPRVPTRGQSKYLRIPKERRISAFERGLVTWIDESYDPDNEYDVTRLNGVNFED